jgi:hypothetical protein
MLITQSINQSINQSVSYNLQYECEVEQFLGLMWRSCNSLPA